MEKRKNALYIEITAAEKWTNARMYLCGSSAENLLDVAVGNLFPWMYSCIIEEIESLRR